MFLKNEIVLTCPPGFEWSGGQCAACNPGSFSAGGTQECLPCPSATYQAQGASSSCTPCPGTCLDVGNGSTSSDSCYCMTELLKPQTVACVLVALALWFIITKLLVCFLYLIKAFISWCSKPRNSDSDNCWTVIKRHTVDYIRVPKAPSCPNPCGDFEPVVRHWARNTGSSDATSEPNCHGPLCSQSIDSGHEPIECPPQNWDNLPGKLSTRNMRGRRSRIVTCDCNQDPFAPGNRNSSIAPEPRDERAERNDVDLEASYAFQVQRGNPFGTPRSVHTMPIQPQVPDSQFHLLRIRRNFVLPPRDAGGHHAVTHEPQCRARDLVRNNAVVARVPSNNQNRPLGQEIAVGSWSARWKLARVSSVPMGFSPANSCVGEKPAANIPSQEN